MARAAERLSNLRSLVSAGAGIRGKLAAAKLIALNQASETPRIVGVPMKGLGGETLYVRSASSDLYNATWYYMDSIQLPPPGVRDEPLEVVCELGTNIGAALTALGLKYPQARLLGVEPDPSNVEMARMNTARFGDRCEIVPVGIASEPGKLVMDRTSAFGSHGYTLRAAQGDEINAEAIDVLPLTMVLQTKLAGAPIDYLHVSIEGAEPNLFSGDTGWAGLVRSLKMELHPYYAFTAEQAIPELERLGFRAWVDPEKPEKWVFAVAR